MNGSIDEKKREEWISRKKKEYNIYKIKITNIKIINKLKKQILLRKILS